MASTGKEKDLKLFEWSVTLRMECHIGNNVELKSKDFFFKQIKFNMKFVNEYYYYRAILYFERSDVNSGGSMKIMLQVSRIGCNDVIKTCNVSHGSQEIWRINHNSVGNISFTFEIFFKDDVKVLEIATTSNSGPSQEKPNPYLGENIHYQSLSKDLTKLLKEDDNSFDVTITCGSKKFKAHKVILQTRSTVLSAMLKGYMVEGKTGLITVKDIKHQTFEPFLRYLYSGKLPDLSMDTVKDFFKVADQYAVMELKKACSQFMIKNLSVTNSCEILVLADLHSEEDFQEKVMLYIVENLIPQRDNNWPSFCECHSTLAVKVLNLYIEKHCNHLRA